jgi:hypothetical protein
MAERAHGTRAKYALDKCRCFPCRLANANYEYERIRGKRAGTWRPFASPTEIRLALAHIEKLRQRGLGLRQIAKVAGVRRQRLMELLNPQRRLRRGRPATRRVRRETIERVLGVRPDQTADRSLVSAHATWRTIESLVAAGVPKARIARALGYRSPALQLRRDRITARNARRVTAFAAHYWQQRLDRALDAV